MGRALEFKRTVCFLGDDLHNLAGPDGQLIRTIAVKVVQDPGGGLLRGRRCRRGRWRWASHRTRRSITSVCGGSSSSSSSRLRDDARLRSCGLWRGLGQRLRGRRRSPSSSGQFRWTTTGTTRSKQFARGDRSGSNLLAPWSRSGHGAGRFAGAGVNCATFVGIGIASLGIFDGLDCGQLAGLFVVFNAASC